MNTSESKKNLTRKISRTINKSLKNNIDPISQSLLTKGGTIGEKELYEYVDRYIHLGFCQKKFYKASAWNRAVVLMGIAIKLGLAKPNDFGRGKGKYDSIISNEEIIKSVNLYLLELGKKNKTLI